MKPGRQSDPLPSTEAMLLSPASRDSMPDGTTRAG